MEKEIFKINENTYKFVWYHFMNLTNMFINENMCIESNKCFPPNILNIDTPCAVLHKSDNEWILILGNSFDTHNVHRCGDTTHQEYIADVVNNEIILHKITEHKFEKMYYEICCNDEDTDDENNKNDDYNKNIKINGILIKSGQKMSDEILELLFSNTLTYYLLSNKTEIQVILLPYEIVHTKSTYNNFDMEHLIFEYNGTKYYYSQVQNYGICCGGGDNNFVQMNSYDDMMDFDFWKIRSLPESGKNNKS